MTVPDCETAEGAIATVPVRPPAIAATPPAAAPPAKTANTIHFDRPTVCPDLDGGDAEPLAGRDPEETFPALSVTNCVRTMPARASPLLAVIRMGTGPAAAPHEIPRIAARPSFPVTAISVRMPLANTPVAPSSGRRADTAAPETGRPASSVKKTMIGCADRVRAV